MGRGAAYHDRIASVRPLTDRADMVRLSVPAAPGYAQVARLTVTAVASRIGFSYDEIEDLRIAVGEVCSLLVVEEPGARLTIHCAVSDEQVVLEATREPAATPIEIGDLSDQILRAVVDDVEVDASAARIVVTKRRQA